MSGANLTGTGRVTFNGVAAVSFTVLSSRRIKATVPSGATSGKMAVTTAGGTVRSSASFKVTVPAAPRVSSFTPASGPTGTTVTVTGTNLSGTGRVTFNGLAATSVSVVSATRIRAIVPSGATTGKIAVTTPGGTTTSSASFTVTVAGSRTYYVSPSGSDGAAGATRATALRTMSAAWALVSSGNTLSPPYRILLLPGVYAEGAVSGWMDDRGQHPSLRGVRPRADRWLHHHRPGRSCPVHDAPGDREGEPLPLHDDSGLGYLGSLEPCRGFRCRAVRLHPPQPHSPLRGLGYLPEGRLRLLQRGGQRDLRLRHRRLHGRTAYLAAGGWGTAAAGDAGRQPIPSRNVFVFNNLLFNPDGYESAWSHFALAPPLATAAGSNIPSPAAAGDNVIIRGNLLWNGAPDLALGIGGDGQGGQAGNAVCNAALVLAQNAVNTVRPALVDPEDGDYRLAASCNVTGAGTATIPAFPGGDRPLRPLAPEAIC